MFRRRVLLARLAAALALLSGMLGTAPVGSAHAATLIVTNTDDSGPGSLREAIIQPVEGNTITFDPALAGQTITLASELVLSHTVTIDASALSAPVVLSGGNTSRIMQIIINANVTISGLTFTQGASPDTGGAISMNGNSQLTLRESTFYQSHAEGGGGAIYKQGSGFVSIEDSIFDQNHAGSGGGAIAISGNAFLTVLDSTFVDNSAGGDGGAIYGTGVAIKNSTVHRNQSDSDGGAITIAGNMNNVISNSTVSGNLAGHQGGGIFVTGNSQASIYNSTFAQNAAGEGTEIALSGNVFLNAHNTIFACTAGSDSCYLQFPTTSINFNHSLLATGTLLDYGLAELADNGGPTQTMALLPASPLIDAGDDSICAGANVGSVDQRGVPRPQGSHCDIGAYEDQSLIRFVNANATGTDDGSSWSNAHTDLQAALAAASPDEEIWVAAGTYRPTSTTDRMISFTLKNGVAVYGGFAGTETARTQRNPEVHVTTLSGDIGIPGNNSDNSYHVVVGSETNNSAILDGFTVSYGKTGTGFGSSAANMGGGMYNHHGSPTVTDVIFTGNEAVLGGGMYNEEGSSPVLINVEFIENVAGSGSGMYNTNSSPSLLNVTFSGNSGSSESRGGALVNDLGSSPSLSNVTFASNTVTFIGGAMLNAYSSNPTLVNVTFRGNLSSDRGGAIYNWQSSPILKNVTFNGNSSVTGGAIYNDENSNPSIVNSILYGNGGGEILNNSGEAIVAYSIVQGGYSGTGNLDEDPLLGPLQDNGGFTQTMALGPGSPAIDVGDDANCPASDQRGVARPQGAGCDIGAYEAQLLNSAPTDIGLSPSSVNENQPVGTTVGLLSTTDADAGDSHTYSFCDGANDASFSISGNQLKTAAVFDYEAKPSYSICIRSTDSGSLSTTKTFTIGVNNLIDTQTFTDVSSAYWACSFIERLYHAGITGGCRVNPLEYCPESTVTRAQMAVFLLRGIHGSDYNPPVVGASSGFGDVPIHYWAAAWIKQLALEGITGGCGAGLYCPEEPVTRAQMAVFLLRAEHGSSYNPPAAGISTGFGDVPANHWAAAWIKQLVSEGITAGCGNGNYCPDAPVSRAQMAVFLVRTFNLP